MPGDLGIARVALEDVAGVFDYGLAQEQTFRSDCFRRLHDSCQPVCVSDTFRHSDGRWCHKFKAKFFIQGGCPVIGDQGYIGRLGCILVYVFH